LIAPYEHFRRTWTAFWGTTYTCEVAPFEEHFLSKLSESGLSATLLADLTCLDEAFAAIEYGRLRRVGKDYVLRPVYWRTGAFHPKTFLFGNQHGGVLLIGSGNAGIGGLMRGREVFSQFRATTETPSAEIGAWARWMALLLESLGDRLLKGRWAELQHRLPWLAGTVKASTFATNWTGSLHDQLIAANESKRVDELHITAPFFDSHGAAFHRLISDLKPRKVRIYLGAETEVDGRDLLKILDREQISAQILRLEPDPFVHGKLFALIRGEQGMVLSGSPNCSRPALLQNVGAGNVEAGVIVKGKAEWIRDLFVPPGMRTIKMKLEEIRSLRSRLSEPSEGYPLKLLRAELMEDRTLSVALAPVTARVIKVQPVGGGNSLSLSRRETEDVPAIGQVMLATTDEPLASTEANMVMLVSASGSQLSNRIAIDDPVRLHQALVGREAGADIDRTFEGEDLDPALLDVLNELRARCSFDVPAAKRHAGARIAQEAAVGDATFWENLAPIELRHKNRLRTARFFGQFDEDEVFAQLRAMLVEAPFVPTLRVISALDQRDEDDTGEAPTLTPHFWSQQARIRVRVRNLLHRWFRSVADPKMREFDPDVCVSNYLEMLHGLVRLWYGDGQTRFLDHDDLRSLWLVLFGALVGDHNPKGLLTDVDTNTRGRLADEVRTHGGHVVSAILTYDVLGAASRDEKLVWQPLLESGVRWGVIDSPDNVVMERIRQVIDFIDDREWCRRTGNDFKVGLELRSGGFHEDVNRVLEIGRVEDLLHDPRCPKLIVACLEYKGWGSIILQANDRVDRISLQADSIAYYNVSGKYSETDATVWISELKTLVASGLGLDRLGWKAARKLA
jgi:hypothetical protein